MINNSSVSPNSVHASPSICLMRGTDQVSETFLIIQEDGQSQKLSNLKCKILSSGLFGLDT
jgi:hypothetical protein